VFLYNSKRNEIFEIHRPLLLALGLEKACSLITATAGTCHEYASLSSVSALWSDKYQYLYQSSPLIWNTRVNSVIVTGMSWNELVQWRALRLIKTP
jgi:hypothetical protein